MPNRYEDYLNLLLDIEDNQVRNEQMRSIPYDVYNKTSEEIENDFMDLVERVLVEKIQALSKSNSAIKQKMTKTQIIEWLKRYVVPKDIDELITAYSITEQKIELFTIEKLMQSSKNKRIKYLVKGLLPIGGLFLLASLPKVGKSLVATSLALSVARGIPFLNRDTEKANVLYIQNEEYLETTTLNRIYNHGLQNLELENPELYKELISSNSLLIARGLDIILDQEKILDLVKEHDISLVIIDSLGASIRRSGMSELNPEIGSYLYGLQNKCQTNDFTIVILHHANKGDSNEDKNKMTIGIAGSNVIMRANDGMLRLFSGKNRQGEDIVYLITIPRDGEQIKMQLRIEREEASYWYFALDKEEAISPEIIELQNDILMLLYEKWELWRETLEEEINEDNIESLKPLGFSLRELMEITNQTKTVLIARLNDMVNTEAIIRYPSNRDGVKEFIYAIPASGESWMKIYLDKEMDRRKEEQKAEKIRQEYIQGIKNIAEELRELLELEKKEDIIILFDDLSEQEKKDVSSELTEEEKNSILLCFYPSDFSIGDEVYIKEEREKGILKIVNIKYYSKAKVGYHKYYLDNIRKPYLKDQLIKNENVCESDN